MRFTPPFTGNDSLDQFLEDISLYLSNQDSFLEVDTGTGVVGNPNGTRLTFLSRYLHVKYANDIKGSGFSNTETSKLCFGLNNSEDPTESADWFDYIWYPATFGLSNKLWYKGVGGRSVQLFVGNAPPDSAFSEAPSGSIDLDSLYALPLDGSVTTPKLADGAVTAIKIDADGTANNTTVLDGSMEWVAKQDIAQLAIDQVVDGAPTDLDTLDKLAAAIGDDDDFFTTVAAALSGKLPVPSGTPDGTKFLRDDNSWQKIPPPEIIVEATTSRSILPADGGTYIRFTSTGAKTVSFDVADSFSAGDVFTISNRAASDDITLSPTGITLNAPKAGSLVLEPNDTVVIRFISSSEADISGTTA